VNSQRRRCENVTTQTSTCIVCLFVVFISSTMRFSRYKVGTCQATTTVMSCELVPQRERLGHAHRCSTNGTSQLKVETHAQVATQARVACEAHRAGESVVFQTLQWLVEHQQVLLPVSLRGSVMLHERWQAKEQKRKKRKKEKKNAGRGWAFLSA
jgi:hypothetical protein